MYTVYKYIAPTTATNIPELWTDNKSQLSTHHTNALKTTEWNGKSRLLICALEDYTHRHTLVKALAVDTHYCCLCVAKCYQSLRLWCTAPCTYSVHPAITMAQRLTGPKGLHSVLSDAQPLSPQPIVKFISALQTAMRMSHTALLFTTAL